MGATRKTAGGKAQAAVEKQSYPIGCIFSTQMSFGHEEVRKSPIGSGLVVPRKSALKELEAEFRGYLEDRYDVDRIQVDGTTIVLIGLWSDSDGDAFIEYENGHPATRAPRRGCHYTYSLCFDSLIDYDFPKSAFRRKDRIEPTKKALREAAREIEEHLGQNAPVFRLETVPNGVMYFMMLDAGVI